MCIGKITCLQSYISGEFFYTLKLAAFGHLKYMYSIYFGNLIHTDQLLHTYKALFIEEGI